MRNDSAAAVPVERTQLPLSMRLWTEGEFERSKSVWDALVHASDADPLFMSWDWQWRWWVHHARALGAQLRLLAIHSGECLVGLAPFYLRTVIVRGLLHAERMELIGTVWRHPQAAFSDYLDILAARHCRDQVRIAVAEWLERETGWDELALCCTSKSGIAAALATCNLPTFAYVREVDELSGWRARLPPNFEDFVARLTSDTRRKVFNQRRKLASPALQYASGEDIPEFLDTLWKFLSRRWGHGGSGTFARAFQVEFAGCMARAGRLRLSRLVTPEGPLSVMYNVQAGRAIYYLQSGFDVERSRGLSPGYLHFGYAIESACREGAEHFDFLAGAGRHRDYKRDLLTEKVPVATYHAVRNPISRTLYKGYDAVGRCRKFLHLC